MQDRFKFRGIRLDNGQWCDGSYLYLQNAPQYKWNGDKTLTKEDVHYIIDENDVNYGVDPETVGQCTGLKDKNGKLIYESDVVMWNNKKHLVQWNKHMCSFILQTSNYDETDVLEFYMTDVQDLEIIGNIYTNPELLEVKE